MSFKRIPHSVSPDDSDGSPGDVQVSTLGYIYLKGADNVWCCPGLMQKEGGKLFDVQGEPLWDSGEDGDISITLSGRWWRKEAGEWIYGGKQGSYGEEPSDLETNNLRVNGNFSLPIISGRVPIYDANGDRFGYLKVYPKR